MPAEKQSRRTFLAALASTQAAQALGDDKPSVPPDTPRKLSATGSDLGSLFADVEKVAALSRPAYTFPGGRFRSFEEFRQAGRDKVLELMLYDPPKVEAKPEVLERVDRGDHV